MLDALNPFNGNKKLVQQQASELETLIATAREERSAISAMLTALTTRTQKLTPLSKSLEQVSDKAASVEAQLTALANRLAAIDERTRDLDAIDRRIEALKETAKKAEQTARAVVGPEGELQKHKQAVQQLSSQALQTQASLDALKKERATLEELRGSLRDAQSDMTQSIGQIGAIRGEFDQIRSNAAALTQEYSRIRDISREAREDTAVAMETIKDVEKKLGPLAQLHELSQSTEKQLTSLNALAEHVTIKAKALEGQQHAVEHAVVQA